MTWYIEKHLNFFLTLYIENIYFYLVFCMFYIFLYVFLYSFNFFHDFCIFGFFMILLFFSKTECCLIYSVNRITPFSGRVPKYVARTVSQLPWCISWGQDVQVNLQSCLSLESRLDLRNVSWKLAVLHYFYIYIYIFLNIFYIFKF